MSGNNAKLREAVSQLRDNLSIHAMMPTDHVSINHVEVDAMVKTCSGALAEPIRNCDRFTDETAAQVAFLNEVWLVSVVDLGLDPFEGWTEQMKERYARWLMAPASEAKGV